MFFTKFAFVTCAIYFGIAILVEAGFPVWGGGKVIHFFGRRDPAGYPWDQFSSVPCGFWHS